MTNDIQIIPASDWIQIFLPSSVKTPSYRCCGCGKSVQPKYAARHSNGENRHVFVNGRLTKIERFGINCKDCGSGTAMLAEKWRPNRPGCFKRFDKYARRNRRTAIFLKKLSPLIDDLRRFDHDRD